MILSHFHKFLFIKTAKTAGTSAVMYLASQCRDGDLVTELSQDEMDDARKNGFIFPGGLGSKLEQARLWWWKQQQGRARGRKVEKNLKAPDARAFVGEQVWGGYYKFCFERNPYDKAISLYYFHNRDKAVKPELNEYIVGADDRKLSNWYMYTIDGTVAVDHIYRFENLADELAAIAARFGMEIGSLPRAKTSSNQAKAHYSKLLGREARQRIEQACANEIAYMGYRWEEA